MEVNDKKELLLIELIKKNRINNHFIQKFRKEYMVHLLKQRRSHNQQKHFEYNDQSVQDFKDIAKVRKLKINTQKNNNDQIQSKSEVVLPQSNRNINKKRKIVEDKTITLITHQSLIKSQNGIKQMSLNCQNIGKKQSRKDCFKYNAVKHGYIWNQNKNNQEIKHKEPLNMIKVSLEKHSFLSYINNRDNYRSLKKKIAINLKNIQFDEQNVFKFSKKSSKTKQKQNHFPLINVQETKYEWNLRDRSFINNDIKRESHKSEQSQKLIHVNSLLCLKQ